MRWARDSKGPRMTPDFWLGASRKGNRGISTGLEEKKSMNWIWDVVWTWDACGIFSMRCLIGSHLSHPEAQKRGLGWEWQVGRHLCLGGSEFTQRRERVIGKDLENKVWEWQVLRGEQERGVSKGHWEETARGMWRNSGQKNMTEVTAARRINSRSGCGQHSSMLKVRQTMKWQSDCSKSWFSGTLVMAIAIGKKWSQFVVGWEKLGDEEGEIRGTLF